MLTNKNDKLFMMDIDERIREFEKQGHTNWPRLIFILRKHLEIWAHKNIKPYWGQMKISYMPVICNISIDGSTAADISQKSMIVKQAMSRTLKELQNNGMITSTVNISDRRSESLKLTPQGKRLVLEVNIEAHKLSDIYKEIVGEKNFEIAVTVLNQIIIYHEKLRMNEEALEGDD